MGAELTRPAGFRWWRHVTLGRAREPASMTATRRDGAEIDLRKTLPGLGARRDPMADDAPGWRPWP